MRPSPKAREAAHTPAPASLLVREPLLLTALLLAILYFARTLLIPLAFALTLAFLLTPLVTRLERLRFHRGPATILVLAAATSLLGGIVWLVAAQLLTIVNDLPSRAPNIRAKLARTHIPPESALGQALTSIEGLSREFSPDPATQQSQQLTQAGKASARVRRAAEAARAQGLAQPTPVVVLQPPPSTLSTLRALVRPVLAPFGTAGMVLIFTVYMLLKREDLRSRILLLAGIGRLHLVSHALDDAAARISRYLLANVSVNAGFGLVFGAALYAIGIPYAVLWGALFALLRTIPYAGTILGGALPALFALIEFPGFWQAACTLAFLLLLEILVTNFLEPWLYGAHTGISALGLLAMAVFWTTLWGWPGLALSTPLTACLIVLGRTLPQLSFLHILLGDDAALAPEAAFYERMLAADSAEARLIAERFLAPPAPQPRVRRSARPGKMPPFTSGNHPGVAAARRGAFSPSPPSRTPAAAWSGLAPTEARSNLDLYEAVLLPALALAENDRHRGLFDERQASWILQSIAELVAELPTYAVTTPPTAASTFPGYTGSLFSGRTGPSLAGEPHNADDLAHSPHFGCPVLCIPALDQADEIAASMLAQLLEAEGHKTLLLPPSALTPELLHRLTQSPETALCISALPPFAFAGARALHARLRSALPRNPITVALWRSPTDPALLAARLGLADAPTLSRPATTLSEALASIPAAPVAHPTFASAL